MKKLTVLVAFFFSVLMFNGASYAKANEGAEPLITDSVLESLTYKDFVKADAILSEIEGFSELSEEEKNKQASLVLTEIAESKIDSHDSGLPTGPNLNSKEIELARQYPYNAVLAFAASELATARTAYFFANPVADNGNANAFKHASWNAFMSKKFGTVMAKQWGDAHENITSGIERDMDLYNNEYGRNEYLRGTILDSEAEIETRILQKIANGNLIRIINNQLRNTDVTGRIR
ncbi:DUF6973 domain-containing protein [Psychrobacillus sp.]|uniref:DUF6973 domain-containing protein n=1 Tax=Psychrobacillus sp. TaxID=1871623 RepID=UPI0028BDDCA9|nr:hypothetical protein [Psychrobacillus sp.]